MPIQRPSWLPSYIPELQGLRGVAVLMVVIYHCHPRLVGTWIDYASLWGWAGVNLFFVLSGFLITSILLEARGKPHYFRNFYGRRVLRIWPVYVLLLVVVYLNAPWFIGPSVGEAIKTAPWLAYIFFVQNLVHVTLPPAIGPTWSLAIEEQYYFVWAPVVRILSRPWMLTCVLAAALIGCPWFRMHHPHGTLTTHTLFHLDGIALGSLMALGLHTLALRRRTWLAMGLGACVIGFWATATVAGGTAFLDSALAVGFAGVVLAAIASTIGVPSDVSSSPRWGSLSWVGKMITGALARGPLAFYGRISYGLYMTHIAVFTYFGWFDLRMDKYGTAGNLAVVGFRLVTTALVATGLWYGFESQVLKLKKYF